MRHIFKTDWRIQANNLSCHHLNFTYCKWLIGPFCFSKQHVRVILLNRNDILHKLGLVPPTPTGSQCPSDRIRFCSFFDLPAYNRANSYHADEETNKYHPGFYADEYPHHFGFYSWQSGTNIIIFVPPFYYYNSLLAIVKC